MVFYMSFNFERLSILVVEDSLPMRNMLAGVLRAMGLGNVYVASEGKHAYQLYLHNRPDIILTDWQMEPEDGLGLVRRIRLEKTSPNKTIPIIMMTGYSALNRIAQARDIGTTEFLVKPFTASDLARRIAYVIEKPRDFVEAQTFFGPDRRRKKINNPKTPGRRKSDRSTA